MYVVIVIPCYNEADRLAVEKFTNFDLPHHRLQFLFVNDGSQDATLGMLEAMQACCPDRISFLDLTPNRGKAEAVRQGFLCALARSPDYVGFWDADLATPLTELPLFCEILDTRPTMQMVFGSQVKLM